VSGCGVAGRNKKAVDTAHRLMIKRVNARDEAQIKTSVTLHQSNKKKKIKNAHRFIKLREKFNAFFGLLLIFMIFFTSSITTIYG
jgi:hypothetical protein